MSRVSVPIVLALLCMAAPALAGPEAIVSDVRIHGNYRTPDDIVLQLAGLTVGQPLGPGGVDAMADRLRKSGRFESVEVRKRYRSFDESGDIAIVIMVQEFPGSVIEIPQGPPNPMRRLGDSIMLAPLFDYTDGYGFTYGGRASFVHVLGKEGRLSVPLTWGGRKQAALEADKTFAAGPLSRIAGAASIWSRENPAFNTDDVRREVSADVVVPVKRRLLSAGIGGGWTDVDFGDSRESFTTFGTRLVLDTRTNPAFPRNAVFASAGWRVFDPEQGPTVNRYHLDAQGYLGLIGSTVLVVRATSETADKPLPLYEKGLVGGVSTLRGFKAGSFVGDNIAAGSIELRLPYHSPMHMGQSGFTVFADAATAYDHGTRLSNAAFHYGVGAGWYLRVPLVSVNLDVAYGIDRGTRAHVTAMLKF